MSKVVIVDYNVCNLDSVARAVLYCGGNPVITNNVKDLETATHIILPGVGSFRQGIENIRKLGLDKVLEDQVLKNKIPLLGICLGMQLLATSGTEGGESFGLNFIPGKVIKLEKKVESERIPHIGWNEIFFSKKSKLFENIMPCKDFYFVHSYHFVCQDQNDILSITPYCGGFISAIEKDNIFGVQFHPEKSQDIGFKVIKNFLDA